MRDRLIARAGLPNLGVRTNEDESPSVMRQRGIGIDDFGRTGEHDRFPIVLLQSEFVSGTADLEHDVPELYLPTEELLPGFLVFIRCRKRLEVSVPGREEADRGLGNGNDARLSARGLVFEPDEPEDTGQLIGELLARSVFR